MKRDDIAHERKAYPPVFQWAKAPRFRFKKNQLGSPSFSEYSTHRGIFQPQFFQYEG